MFTTLITCN